MPAGATRGPSRGECGCGRRARGRAGRYGGARLGRQAQPGVGRVLERCGRGRLGRGVGRCRRCHSCVGDCHGRRERSGPGRGRCGARRSAARTGGAALTESVTVATRSTTGATTVPVVRWRTTSATGRVTEVVVVSAARRTGAVARSTWSTTGATSDRAAWTAPADGVHPPGRRQRARRRGRSRSAATTAARTRRRPGVGPGVGAGRAWSGAARRPRPRRCRRPSHNSKPHSPRTTVNARIPRNKTFSPLKYGLNGANSVLKRSRGGAERDLSRRAE